MIDVWESIKPKTQTDSFVSLVKRDLIPTIGKENLVKIAKNYAVTKFTVYDGDDVTPPYTPTALIKEITDKLTSVDFSTAKFLVIYTVEWANYLHAIHDVPLENITVVCDSRREQFCRFAGYSVISADDFLADEFNQDENMKFDVVVGNPPYQDSSNKAANNKLWHKFVKRCDPKLRNPITSNNSIIALVTPSSIFIDYVGFGKWFIDEYLESKCLIEAKIHREFKHFDAMVETCHWIISNKAGVNLVDLPRMRDSIIDKIIDKVDVFEPKLKLVHENPEIVTENLHQGTHNFYYSGKNITTTDVKPNNSGKLKIVFPFSASYHSQFITDESTGHFNKSFFVDDQEHAKRVMSYTMSKLYRFFAQYYLKTSGFTPAVKNSRLPMLEDKEYSDEMIYQIFNLSQEEIDYVESTIK
jgi:hypothetical protein